MTPDPIQPTQSAQTSQPAQPNRAVTPSSPARWHRASEIYVDSLEQAAGAPREAYFSLMCAGDDVLLQLVRSLIERESRTAPLLRPTYRAGAWAAALAADADQSGDGAASAGGAERWIGRRLGSYKITAEIARGGMGWVFKGLRDDAEFSKDVAIKLVRDSGDQARLIERFKAERQILATLDHPNIARLIDGGSTEEGFPFLVMEFVDGEPITDYARRNELGIGAKLELFRAVCAAVHFAHQRLVVHRDLKPSNIFVTHAGEVKLLDFGIAKMLQPTSPSPRADGTDPAATTLLAMTPAYASPEQIKGETITTASDVYALGVVLYELLTGQSPYKSASTQPMALAKEICETDPERPSTVVGRTLTPTPTAVIEGTDVSSAAAVNAVEATPPALNALSIKRLQRGLRGDLDNIVLMALRKDPARRYASAEQLAEDVKRFGQNLPVSARADTFSYRATKFVQRNRWAVGFASLSFLGLIAGIVGTTYQAARAEREKNSADQHFANVREVSNAMLFDVFEEVARAPGTLKAQQLILKKSADYLERLSQNRPNDSTIVAEAGVGFSKMAALKLRPLLAQSQASEYASRAVVLLEDAHRLSPTDSAIAVSLTRARADQARVLDELDRFDEALAAFKKADSLSSSLPIGLQTIEQKLERAKTLSSFGGAHALFKSLEERLQTLYSAKQMLDGLISKPLSPAQRDVAESSLLRLYLTIATAEAVKPSGQGAEAAYSFANLAAAGFTSRLSTTTKANANTVINDKKNLAVSKLQVAMYSRELNRSIGQIQLLNEAKLLIEHVVSADPLDMQAQMIATYVSAGTFDEFVANKKFAEIIVEAVTAKDRIAKLPNEVRAQVFVQDALVIIQSAEATAHATLGADANQSKSVRLQHWRLALKGFSEASINGEPLKAHAQGDELKRFDEVANEVERCKREIAKLEARRN